MLTKNSVPFGFLIGSLLPAITWLVFGVILHNEALIMDKPAAPYLIAICLNLVLLRYCFRNNMEKAANGIMMTTFGIMLAVFIFKIHSS